MKMSSRMIRVTMVAVCVFALAAQAQMQRPAAVVMARRGTTVLEADLATRATSAPL